LHALASVFLGASGFLAKLVKELLLQAVHVALAEVLLVDLADLVTLQNGGDEIVNDFPDAGLASHPLVKLARALVLRSRQPVRLGPFHAAGGDEQQQRRKAEQLHGWGSGGRRERARRDEIILEENRRREMSNDEFTHGERISNDEFQNERHSRL